MKIQFQILLITLLLNSFSWAQNTPLEVVLHQLKNEGHKDFVVENIPTKDSIMSWSEKEIHSKGIEKVGYSIDLNSTITPSDSVHVLIAKKAKALSITFSQLETGAEFYILNTNKSAVWGPYSPNKNGVLSLPLIENDSVFFLSKNQHKPFFISSIVYFFTDQKKDFGDAGSCNVNVNCDEGVFWTRQRDATVRILAKVGNFTYWCSGTLVNNTNNDLAPYVLTAMHCGTNSLGDLVSQTNFDYWQFYFQYQSLDCDDPIAEGILGANVLTGADIVAWSHDKGGETGSDFLLIKLQTLAIPLTYNPIFNGWDKSGTGSNSGVSIHHPNGDIKKISTYGTPLQSTSYTGQVNDTHWEVVWEATTNGHGVTEAGSSGSPLFNADKLLIGTLTGGSAFCTQPNEPDDYGKFSYHWKSNGTDSTYRVDVWLDPLGLNPTTWPSLKPGEPASVGDESKKASVFTVYPNPFESTFSISSTKNSAFSWTLISATGEIISTGNNENIEAKTERLNLKSGLYFIRILGDQNETLKIVKQ